MKEISLEEMKSARLSRANRSGGPDLCASPLDSLPTGRQALEVTSRGDSLGLVNQGEY
jgi:hypothetical protein